MRSDSRHALLRPLLALLPLLPLLLAAGCSAMQPPAATAWVQCPEIYNGCYAD